MIKKKYEKLLTIGIMIFCIGVSMSYALNVKGEKLEYEEKNTSEQSYEIFKASIEKISNPILSLANQPVQLKETTNLVNKDSTEITNQTDIKKETKKENNSKKTTNKKNTKKVKKEYLYATCGVNVRKSYSSDSEKIGHLSIGDSVKKSKER